MTSIKEDPKLPLPVVAEDDFDGPSYESDDAENDVDEPNEDEGYF